MSTMTGPASNAVAFAHPRADDPALRRTLLSAFDHLASWAALEMAWSVARDEELLSAVERGTTVAELATLIDAPELRVEALLRALENHGVLSRDGSSFRLAEEWSALRDVRGWLELLLGGYHGVFRAAGELTRHGDAAAARDPVHVAAGSGGITTFDAAPMMARLIAGADAGDAPLILDYGCGDGTMLRDLCRHFPGARGFGLEVDPRTVARAAENLAGAGLGDRVTVERGMAPASLPDLDPDFVILAFVLHEVLGQAGREGLVEFMRSLREAYPRASLLAVEVLNPRLVGLERLLAEDPQGRGYYNPYIWLHYVTRQELVDHETWKELFDEAGFEIVATDGVDPGIDPTGLEVGYLARPTGQS
ncbi:MAG: hypothetical protein CSA58_12670 [Micrococcales bacterium]|nr:MAG: hypothetical protein CSA58_12670 [Micrococcales bacterium]